MTLILMLTLFHLDHFDIRAVLHLFNISNFEVIKCFLLLQPEFQDIITDDILQQLLNAIPDSMQSKDLTMWLQQDIIPFVNHRFPEGKVSVT